MDEFRPWVAMIDTQASRGALGEPVELHALMAHELVFIVSGADVREVSLYPPAHLALGPVTYGGMVRCRTGEGSRAVCANHAGAVAVFHATPGRISAVPSAGADEPAIKLLTELMDPAVGRPSPAELMARMVAWAWLTASHRVGRTDIDQAVKAFASSDLDSLATLGGIVLPEVISVEAICTMAITIGHPRLELPASVQRDTTERQLAYLHALLPTRWMLANEIRQVHRRPDLAAMVMATPAL
jgi:hypothetical protein